MGYDIKKWAELKDAIYMGANTNWEVIWLGISVACCVLALIVGSKHELDAYKREQEKNKN